MNNEPIENKITDLRVELKVMASVVKGLMNIDITEPNANVPEVKANIMLAYRHVEDATMRLGKVLQALNGGVSIYDK